MGRYRKTIAALLGTLVTWLTASALDTQGNFDFGHINGIEWLALIAAVGTVLGVYGTPNDPPGTP